MHKLKVLIADDQLHYRAVLKSRLQTVAGDVCTLRMRGAKTAQEAVLAVQESIAQGSAYDLILLDVNFEPERVLEDGHWASSEIREILPDAIIAVVSSYDDEEHMQLASNNESLTRFFRKGLFTDSELRQVAIAALAKRLDRENMLLSSPAFKIISQDEQISEVIDQVDFLSPQTNALVFGETGTGKELIARRINAVGGLATGASERPLVALNCGAVSDTLVESVLFGHKKGAFTGANSDKTGLIAEAEGGDLFLDEIQNASEKLQKVLMRALEAKEYTPVGSSTSIPSNCRIIAATNKSPESMVNELGFLPDLLARLRHSMLTLPPLRQRQADIELLASETVMALDADKSLSKDAMDFIEAQTWPTNVRGLISYLKELLNHSKMPVISQRAAESLYNELFPPQPASSPRSNKQIAEVEGGAMSLNLSSPFSTYTDLENSLFVGYISELKKDKPDISLREIAKISGIPFSTIRKRIKKLEK